jgi:hypothetical protein
VEALGRGSVEAWKRGSVGAWERGSVGALERGSVGALGRGSVGALKRWSVGAWERGNVGAWERGNVGAWERGSVGAWERGSFVVFVVFVVPVRTFPTESHMMLLVHVVWFGREGRESSPWFLTAGSAHMSVSFAAKPARLPPDGCITWRLIHRLQATATASCPITMGQISAVGVRCLSTVCGPSSTVPL